MPQSTFLFPAISLSANWDKTQFAKLNDMARLCDVADVEFAPAGDTLTEELPLCEVDSTQPITGDVGAAGVHSPAGRSGDTASGGGGTPSVCGEGDTQIIPQAAPHHFATPQTATPSTAVSGFRDADIDAITADLEAEATEQLAAPPAAEATGRLGLSAPCFATDDQEGLTSDGEGGSLPEEGLGEGFDSDAQEGDLSLDGKSEEGVGFLETNDLSPSISAGTLSSFIDA